MALLVGTGGAPGQVPPGDSSDLDRIRALGLDSLVAGVTVYYSPGYRERAAAIGPMLYDALRFYADSLGVRTDFRLGVLDRDAWGRVSGHPYGLPYVSSRNGVSVAVLPADGAGAVYDAYRAYEERLPPRIRDRVERLGLTWDQAARQMVDLIGLHGVEDYIWYQSAFAKRAGTLVEQHGFRFLERLRHELASTSHGQASNAELLHRLEALAPGFQEWAAAFRDSGALERRSQRAPRFQGSSRIGGEGE